MSPKVHFWKLLKQLVESFEVRVIQIVLKMQKDGDAILGGQFRNQFARFGIAVHVEVL